MSPKHLIQLSWQLPLLLLVAFIGLPDVRLVHPQWGYWPLWLIAPAIMAFLVSKTNPIKAPNTMAKVLVFPAKRQRLALSKGRVRKVA